MARNEYMEGLPSEYYYPDEFAYCADFFKSYRVEYMVGSGNKVRGLKPKSERICRFCGKGKPDVVFKDDAHWFPESIGNRYLLSDFECADCNKLFSQYEGSLANFLGMSRTLLSVKGKKKIPTFKDKTVRVESFVDPIKGVSVNASRMEVNDSFLFDPNTGLLTVSGVKQSYVPLYAYKAFLKMALCCLSDRDILEYPLALEFLRTENVDQYAPGITWMYRYTYPYNFLYETPVGIIFKKRDVDSQLISHIFVLFTLNGIFELAIPLHQDDFKNAGKDFGILWSPPMFSNPYHFPTKAIRGESLDLSSAEIRRDERDSFSIAVGEDGKIAARFVHPETGEVVFGTIDVNDIQGVKITRQSLPDRNGDREGPTT